MLPLATTARAVVFAGGFDAMLRRSQDRLDHRRYDVFFAASITIYARDDSLAFDTAENIDGLAFEFGHGVSERPHLDKL